MAAWNERKFDALPRSLAERYAATPRRLEETTAEFDCACEEVRSVVPAADFSKSAIGRYRRAVTEAAAKQLDRSLRHSNREEMEYYKLLTEVQTAESLFQMANLQAADVLMCSPELHSIREAALKRMDGLDAKRARVSEMEKKLLAKRSGVEASGSVEESHNGFEGLNEDDKVERVRLLRKDCRAQLADETLRNLENHIEGLLHSFNAYEQRIKREADTSKLRTKIKEKRREVAKEIEKAVSQYNLVLTASRRSDPRR